MSLRLCVNFILILLLVSSSSSHYFSSLLLTSSFYSVLFHISFSLTYFSFHTISSFHILYLIFYLSPHLIFPSLLSPVHLTFSLHVSCFLPSLPLTSNHSLASFLFLLLHFLFPSHFTSFNLIFSSSLHGPNPSLSLISPHLLPTKTIFFHVFPLNLLYFTSPHLTSPSPIYLDLMSAITTYPILSFPSQITSIHSNWPLTSSDRPVNLASHFSSPLASPSLLPL